MSPERTSAPDGPVVAMSVLRREPPRRPEAATVSHEPQRDLGDGVTSLVTFELAPDGDATVLTLTHEGLPDQAQADSHAAGLERDIGEAGSPA